MANFSYRAERNEIKSKIYSSIPRKHFYTVIFFSYIQLN